MEQRADPGFAGLQKPSDANITLSTISFHSVKIYCLTRVIFSGARCCNILQQPPKRPAGQLCFCISAVHHWSRPFGAKSVVAFSLASVSTLFLWRKTPLQACTQTEVFAYGCVSTEIPTISDVPNFPNFLKVIKNTKPSFLFHLITQLTFILTVKISLIFFLKDGSYLKGLNHSQKSPQKKATIIHAQKHDFN